MITIEDIITAKNTIKSHVKRTDVLKVNKLSAMTNMNVFLKLENLQSSGSFKIRGACNKLANLSQEELQNGVICASAGNHAQGVASAANIYQTSATVIMPTSAPISKIKATKDYGAEVMLCGDIFDDAFLAAVEQAKSNRKTMIHAFNDPLIIAGQGTVGLEIYEQVENLDVVLVPIGGGGLISGVAVAIKSLNPNIKIIGIQAENSQNMKKSFDCKEVVVEKTLPSIADGIAVKYPGDITYQMICKYVDEIITVTEDEIASAILYLLEQCKIVSEGSGAACVAAIMHGKVNYPKQNIVGIISGGNIDVDLIETIINKGLVADDRRFELKVIIKDRTGEMQRLLAIIAAVNGNIFALEQRRFSKSLNINEQEVTVVIGAFDLEHKKQIIEEIKRSGYKCFYAS